VDEAGGETWEGEGTEGDGKRAINYQVTATLAQRQNQGST